MQRHVRRKDRIYFLNEFTIQIHCHIIAVLFHGAVACVIPPMHQFICFEPLVKILSSYYTVVMTFSHDLSNLLDV